MCAGFPAGLADGHQLVNRGERPALYLEVSNRDPADSASYADADVDLMWKPPHAPGQVPPPRRDSLFLGSVSRSREPQHERHADLVPHLVGGFPFALADAEVEPAHGGLAAHVAGGHAALVDGAKRERHACIARHAAEGELADRFIAAGG